MGAMGSHSSPLSAPASRAAHKQHIRKTAALTRAAQLAHFQAVFNDLLPNAVKRCFGRPLGEDNDFCLEHGLKRATTEEVINRYLLEMREYMAENGLKFPALTAFDDARAELLPSTREIISSLQ
mgnify:CR=1 FL=1